MTIKKPLTVKCFKCSTSFEIKWVIGHRGHSKKNDWDYWTENEENKEKKICNDCLKKLYQEKWDYYETVSSKKKALFRVYLSGGKFN